MGRNSTDSQNKLGNEDDPRVAENPDRDSPVLITREHAVRAIQNALKTCGYAVAVHGSMIRDVDLVAIPWTEKAVPAERAVKRAAASLPGIVGPHPGEEKPHGRRAWTIYPKWLYGSDRWYVDLSVMPLVTVSWSESPQGAVEVGYETKTHPPRTQETKWKI